MQTSVGVLIFATLIILIQSVLFAALLIVMPLLKQSSGLDKSNLAKRVTAA